jgi:hypothetical protein
MVGTIRAYLLFLTCSHGCGVQEKPFKTFKCRGKVKFACACNILGINNPWMAFNTTCFENQT